MNKNYVLGAISASILTAVAVVVIQVKAGDQPPADIGDAALQYMRTGVPQSGVRMTITAGTSSVATRGSSEVCWKHGSQVRIKCDTETFLVFTESVGPLNTIGVDASWGTATTISDSEGDSTAGNRVGPASGPVPHGEVIDGDGWTYLKVPSPLDETQVGYRGGVCYKDQLAPCDDDADCAAGTCTDDFAANPDAKANRMVECMYIQADAAANAVCYLTTYR